MTDTVSCEPGTLRLAAVGDLLLAPPLDGTPYPRNRRLVDDSIRQVFSECDLVLGNLECTLPGDGACVPTEPRVVATPDLVRAVAEAGFGVVTLANNHAFDCCEPGFQNLKGLLGKLRLPHFGAGMNLEEAAAPLFLDVRGLRIALLGAVDARSGPSHFATPSGFGVAPLNIERLERQVGQLRSQVSHVIVSLHWGDERFSIPSPAQIEQAHRLVASGASIVLGHHPHVLQGAERVDGKPIAYSLGNFFADEVHLSDGDAVRWDRTGRTGAILVAKLSKNGVAEVRHLPTYDSGRLVELDRSGFGGRRIERTARAIAQGVSPSRYRREHLWVNGVKPALRRLRWSELARLRPRDFAKAVRVWREK
ncbi:MAG: CapA family protein [Pirellulales bacterium]|nr:CapA family protein [Thermoguttaceae bacterium]MDD4788354.1 CapA family protein [Pirellulales bacterium]MDI9444165.1 CapA family protein [Planctomycetota bacterium]NLY99821.1 CapA family protein [Pirellulaceae bacterium]